MTFQASSNDARRTESAGAAPTGCALRRCGDWRARAGRPAGAASAPANWKWPRTMLTTDTAKSSGSARSACAPVTLMIRATGRSNTVFDRYFNRSASPSRSSRRSSLANTGSEKRRSVSQLTKVPIFSSSLEGCWKDRLDRRGAFREHVDKGGPDKLLLVGKMIVQVGRALLRPHWRHRAWTRRIALGGEQPRGSFQDGDPCLLTGHADSLTERSLSST